MRTITLAVVAAGLAAGLAGCSPATSSGSAAPGASGSASAPSAGTSAGASAGSESGGVAGANGGVANSCVVGTWKSTGANGSFNAGSAHGTLTGGSGLLLTVAGDGATTVNFNSMQPVNFDSSINNTPVQGRFTYGGTATGKIQVNDGMATKGTWAPVGTSDWRNMTITVELLKPIQDKIFDHAKIADFTTSANSQTGNSVDVQPILQKASYECSGNTLTIGPPPGVNLGGVWTLTKA